jgi:hypothetical protein
MSQTSRLSIPSYRLLPDARRHVARKPKRPEVR